LAIRKDWKIERSTRRCCACKTGFEIKQKYYSAIYPLAGAGMLRRDFCLSCWPKYREGDVPPLEIPQEGQAPVVTSGPYMSYWKTSVPEPKQKEKRLEFNPQVAFAVFQQSTDGETSPDKERLRFILALSLVRHKVLKLRTIERREKESWMILTDKAKTRYEVRDPGISEQEMLSLMQNIGKLLEMPLDGGEPEMPETCNEADVPKEPPAKTAD
jgi:hypothetical protein